ncbi:MAG: 2-C-methyl-D-erythritol 4-phosphate cytidylyltransferase [Agathobacter sp.]|nr:2-C-methyl-D-erythritol 4-phosphate cytidylyltransferase [Agathobacter sp.]
MNNETIFAAILAGGVGTRMQSAEKPKQFLEVGGKPIIIHTIEKFISIENFTKILVLTPEDWVDYTRDLIENYMGTDSGVLVLPGGADRNETLMCALAYIEEHYKVDADTILVTHDAVRPFVTERIIRENMEAAGRYGACGTAIPATDTIVQSRDGKYMHSIPDRSCMYQQQTPQSFRVTLLKETYALLNEEERKSLTDACKILVLKGVPVYMVMGDSCNIKITYPEDLLLSEVLVHY